MLLEEETDRLVLADEVRREGVTSRDGVEGEGGEPFQPGVRFEVFPGQERADGWPAELGGVPGVAPGKEDVEGIGLDGHHLAHAQRTVLHQLFRRHLFHGRLFSVGDRSERTEVVAKLWSVVPPTGVI